MQVITVIIRQIIFNTIIYNPNIIGIIPITAAKLSETAKDTKDTRLSGTSTDPNSGE